MQINQNNSENELVESQLRLEITEKNNRIRTQQQEMQRQYREYESIICEKDGEISSTRAELLFLETKCETLERDNTRLSQKVEEYVDRLRNRDLTKESELRGRIKELEEELGRRDEVELLSSDIQEQKYCQSVSQDNQFQKGERLKLQMQIDDLQDRYRRDLKDLNKADEQVKELKAQLKDTQQKLYLAEGYVAVNQQLNLQIEKLNTQLAQSREQVGHQQL
eukprot:TRINITY_DN14137_c0_g1_i5.p2 TRINITY_DN14137_c0_g1~~TRINITY_DN14137_c0_g1_i5.p2  ORF type:complete len:222 (-),score=34.69 TRINITY_DN14137_c0_g1_i5:429-1094(-)